MEGTPRPTRKQTAMVSLVVLGVILSLVLVAVRGGL
jgi:hypothetical protein